MIRTGVFIYHSPPFDSVRLLHSSHRLHITIVVQGLPNSEASVNHSMMQPEHRVVRRVIEIGHVPVSTSNAMDSVVKTFQAIGVRNTWANPCFVAKLGEIVVECEEIVETILERNSAVVKSSSYFVVLADCALGPIASATTPSISLTYRSQYGMRQARAAEAYFCPFARGARVRKDLKDTSRSTYLIQCQIWPVPRQKDVGDMNTVAGVVDAFAGLDSIPRRIRTPVYTCQICQHRDRFGELIASTHQLLDNRTACPFDQSLATVPGPGGRCSTDRRDSAETRRPVVVGSRAKVAPSRPVNGQCALQDPPIARWLSSRSREGWRVCEACRYACHAAMAADVNRIVAKTLQTGDMAAGCLASGMTRRLKRQ
ncbi:hypothetical protein KC330_g157 [Hortaea werneckii]|nr:hypothetical protein KC330_g157 [Hortaea werneckii]